MTKLSAPTERPQFHRRSALRTRGARAASALVAGVLCSRNGFPCAIVPLCTGIAGVRVSVLRPGSEHERVPQTFMKEYTDSQRLGRVQRTLAAGSWMVGPPSSWSRDQGDPSWLARFGTSLRVIRSRRHFPVESPHIRKTARHKRGIVVVPVAALSFALPAR